MEGNVKMVDADTIVVPGHGAIGNKQDLIAWRDMLVGSRENVAKLKKDGRSVDETIAVNPTKQWDPIFGQFVISPPLFTRLIYEGV